MRTTLTSGAWVEHTPIQELRGKHKRNLDRVGKPRPVFGAGGEYDQAATMSGMDVMGWQAARRDAVWAMVITGWSYELAVPELGDGGQVADVDSFGELPLEDFEELEALLKPFEEKLARRPDPKGAITSGSNGSSRESAAASPTA
jgi:hypothetical protein